MNETDLILEREGEELTFPFFSARKCSQSLTPIPQGILRRTLNGTLVWAGSLEYRKFQSTIRCMDKAPPAFEGLWIGMILRVGCLQFLTQAISDQMTIAHLEREAVVCHLYDSLGEKWPLERPEGRRVSLPSRFPGGFLTYRPWLLMMVKSFQLERSEWGGSVGWQLDLEEV